ncbi:MAG TPA: serine protease [Planctomycetaceae bacterium]|nr:serine protease [Planctomycetaceae bacterium]
MALATLGYCSYPNETLLASTEPSPRLERAAVSVGTRQVPLAAGKQFTRPMIERAAAAVYDHAWRALVRIEDESGEVKVNPSDSGVLVTDEGHVLYRAFAGETKLRFRLHDGRRATATTLGWSSEWGVGLAKLDGPGPWPHVELADSPTAKAGRCVVTLGYAWGEPPELFGKPLLGLDSVIAAASGRWFATSDCELTWWRNSPAAFDLDGRLTGVSWLHYLGGAGVGTVYTDATIIRTLWKDLLAGKNLDHERLAGIGQPDNPKSDRNGFSLDKPISPATEEGSSSNRPNSPESY